MSTVVADRSASEERTVGAHQPVIVKRGHHRNPPVAASIKHSSAEQGKRVVDMDDLGAVLAQHCLQVTACFAAPDGPDRKRCFLRHRPLVDLIAATAEPHDLVSQGFERLALLVDDPILSAGSSRAVAVVDKQDPHPGWVTSLTGAWCAAPTREPAGRNDTCTWRNTAPAKFAAEVSHACCGRSPDPGRLTRRPAECSFRIRRRNVVPSRRWSAFRPSRCRLCPARSRA